MSTSKVVGTNQDPSALQPARLQPGTVELGPPASVLHPRVRTSSAANEIVLMLGFLYSRFFVGLDSLMSVVLLMLKSLGDHRIPLLSE